MANNAVPPANVDVTQRALLGLDYRKLAILVVALGGALGLLIGWRAAPLYMRGALGAFAALAGIALAFGRIEGLLPEQALLNFIAHLRDRNFKLHRAHRAAFDNRTVTFGPDPAAQKEARPALRVKFPDFYLLTANALGAGVLTGLTLWLAQGGGHQLLLWWGSQTTIAGA